MTAKEIAEAATMDAPATSVAVNDLEDRGLVVREANPNNRRCKVISLTDEGRRTVASIERVDDPAPRPFAVLSRRGTADPRGDSGEVGRWLTFPTTSSIPADIPTRANILISSTGR